MKRFLFTLITLISFVPTFANHVRGGVITYKHLTGKKYEVYVAIWRDCAGIQLSHSNVQILNDTFGIIGTISSQTKVSVKDISLTDSLGSCGATNRCYGSSSVLGFEEHLWKMTVDFSVYSPHCEFYLTWTQSNRSQSVTTGSANQNFFMDTYINLCHDSLPRSVLRSNPPDFTILHNNDYSFTPAFYSESDYFDSLSYELAPALNYMNTSVTYSGNYHPTRPLTFFGFPNSNLTWPAGLRINAQTGTLMFRPTQVNQMGPIAILYKGWRKVNDTMRLVGYNRLDYSPVIISGNGSFPLYNLNVTERIFDVCEGSTFCKEFSIDANGDSLFMEYLTRNPRISLDSNGWYPDSIGFKVCFSPDSSDKDRPDNLIFLNIYRSACPYMRRHTLQLKFNVIPAPDSSKKPAWHTERSCNILSLYAIDSASSGKPIFIKGHNASSYINDTAIINLQASDTGWFKYQVMQDWTGCQLVFEDSVYIEQVYDFKLSPFIPYKPCFNSDLSFTGNASGGIGVQEWLWSDSTTSDSFSLTITNDTSFWVYALDSSGCTFRDTFSLRMNDTLFTQTPQISICTELPNSPVSLLVNANGGTLPYTVEWVGVGTGNNSSFYPPMADTSLLMKLTDSVGCIEYDTLELKRYVPHYPISINDTSGCYLGDIQLKVLNKVNHGTYQWNGVMPADSIQYFPPVGNSTRYLKYTDSLGCITSDSVNIYNHRNPVVQLPNDTVLCNSSTLQIDVRAFDGKRPYSYNWVPLTSTTDSFIVSNFTKSSIVYVEVNDSNGCEGRDSMNIVIDGIPQISGNSPYNYCRNNGSFNLSSISGSLNGIWIGPSVYQNNGNYYFDAQLHNAGSYSFRFESQNNAGSCVASDSLLLYLLNPPAISTTNDTNVCIGDSIYIKANHAGTGTLNYYWNFSVVPGIDSIVLVVMHDSLIHVKVTDANGCSSEDTTQVKAVAFPNAHLLSPSIDSICNNLPVWVEIDTNGLGANGWVQTIPANLNGTFLLVDRDTSIRVITTNAVGCISDSNWHFRSLASPQISIVDTQYSCADVPVINLLPWAGPAGGMWYSPSAIIQSGNFISASADTGFNKLYYAATANGCTSVDSLLLYLEQAPTVAFTADSTQGGAPLQVKFTNQSTGTHQYYFTWYFGDGDSSQQEHPVHQYSNPGVYPVSLEIDGNYCHGHLTRNNFIWVDSSGGVGIDFSDGNLIRVYPNPGNGTFFIEGLKGGESFKAYSMEGKELEVFVQLLNSGLYKIQFPEFAQGVYQLKVSSASGASYVLSIVIE